MTLSKEGQARTPSLEGAAMTRALVAGRALMLFTVASAPIVVSAESCCAAASADGPTCEGDPQAVAGENLAELSVRGNCLRGFGEGWSTLVCLRVGALLIYRES
jgi:hypothetical protein